MIRSLLLRILPFLFSSLPVAAGADPAPRDIFLLIGQSNMAGRGAIEEQDKIPHPRIFVLNEQKMWVPAVDPLHFDKPAMVGVGLGSAFARVVAEAEPSALIGLVPAAFGGTSLDQWAPGGELYTHAVDRARLALATGARLRAILWHQGESDSTAEKAATYAVRFDRMITRLRADLGSPDVPVIVGELLHRRTASAVMNPVLRNLPNSIARCLCVSANGLSDKGDQTHFDSASLRELGRRYARAFLSMPAANAAVGKSVQRNDSADVPTMADAAVASPSWAGPGAVRATMMPANKVTKTSF